MDPLAERRLRSVLEHLLGPESNRSVRSSPTSEAYEDVVQVPGDFAKKSLLSSRSQYEQLYEEAVTNPDGFWGRVAAGYFWQKLWDTSKPVCNYNFDADKGRVFVEWFKGGFTNVCYNALDRHVLAGYGHELCFLWEGNDPGQSAQLTYSDVLKKVCQVANFLRSKNVKKGDRVCIYMSMILELPIAMLACARLGVIHSVVFAGFSSESLAGRILDCQAKVLLTCAAGRRGNKLLPLKDIVDHALEICLRDGNLRVETCLVYENSFALPRQKVSWVEGRDIWWQETVSRFSVDCPVEWMEAEDPLFMLYTSGSTGKPKGLIHSVGGYMVYAGFTFKHVFDHQRGDIFWCTADCGWITGHTYVTYGPLLNRATCVIFEGVPTFPDAGRWWEIVDKYQVSILYAAPTAIRTLAAQGDEIVRKYSRKSLRLLGSVGEPISPKTWRWYYEVCGESRCPVIDTWWQTETGACMISPLPGAWPMKPGCATLPFFGVQTVVLDQEGKELHGPCEGYLCIKGAWPGIARTVYGDHSRYENTYFKIWKGLYSTGDGCRRDADGFIWITGRVDDVLNVSGHRISTGEVEGALVSHPHCTEAAVVGYDHDVKGQGIYAFVTLSHEATPSDALKKQLRDIVRKQIGAFAAPEVIHWAVSLPRTRSGKIMRRILRKIAARQYTDIGDTSSLADPSVVEDLIKGM
ncbi:hypothetical protein R1flu_004652 [Riccia fluitans]|uniref:Acetyl-coenzyme A synthetase n=1 Tax=Riccia fluitans TaxID=41844 RepID=A0ABD1YRJ4_9MARC